MNAVVVDLGGASFARRRRAQVAGRLMEFGPDDLAALDWDDLDAAPDWLALPGDELAALRCRVGAVLLARTLRLWIDAARLGAARAALGDGFLEALLAAPDLATPAPAVRVEGAAQVRAALQSAGGSVLLAALPEGPMRDAAAAVLAPALPAPLTPAQAAALIERAHTLGEAAPARSAA